MGKQNRSHRAVALIVLLSLALPVVAREPLSVDQGKSGLLLTLRKLRSTGRLMHTAAHPDDEDGGMLTLESRGHGNYCVQMTLTRGEGGQNAVGKELGDELGMLRTLELLEADRYYNVEQRFSRVADFGFSKTAEETLKKWDAEHTALPDLVRVIRELKPDVVISRFIGDPSDGHGNHQASGILTREAFRAAGDPNRFPEQIKEGLQPWQPKKLYVRAKGDDWNVELDVNQNDPILGMSYVAWGWQGLKHQLSQGAANWQMPTRMWTSHYKLVDTTLPNYHPGHEKDFFDGIDTSLVGLAARAPHLELLKSSLQELQGYVDQASGVADQDPKAAAVPLLKGLAATEKLISQVKASNVALGVKSDLLVNLQDKRNEFRDGANLALGNKFHVSAMPTAIEYKMPQEVEKRIMAVPGQQFLVDLSLYRESKDLVDGEVTMQLPAGSKAEIRPGNATVTISETAPYSRQYWHRDDPDRDAIYTIDDPQFATLPLTPAPMHAHANYSYLGFDGDIDADVEVVFATVPPVLSNGYLVFPETERHDFMIGPAWSILLPQSTLVLPVGAKQHTTDVLSVTTNLRLENAATPGLQVRAPAGWKSTDFSGLSLATTPGTPRTVEFDLEASHLTEGRWPISAHATFDNRTFDLGYTVVTREDLGTAYYFRRAVQPVSIIDVNVPRNLKIGYIMGAGDDIPDVLKSLGLNVTLITPEELESGDLSKFDTIVLGIRPYEAREDLRQNNQRLLDYVKNGGTMMVQYIYNTGQFEEGHFAPYPMSISRNNRDRVTVEEAPVEILDPQNPVFHTPNQISPKDFDGWVQERALYCPTEWDSHYTPLLSSHDPNDPPEKGGLLIAKYGKGTYIFNAWAFFRQLPAGVPGAIRLYVNLLAAGHQ